MITRTMTRGGCVSGGCYTSTLSPELATGDGAGVIMPACVVDRTANGGFGDCGAGEVVWWAVRVGVGGGHGWVGVEHGKEKGS